MPGGYSGRYITSPYSRWHPGHPDYPRRRGESVDPMARAAWEREMNKSNKKAERISENKESEKKNLGVNTMNNSVSVTNWVSVASADDNTIEFQEITKEILWPALQMPVILSVPHGGEISLSTGKNNFFIFIWASTHRPQGSLESGLLGERIMDAPKTIWGIPVDCRTWVFAPSGKGKVIYDGEYAAAELVGNNLFIHHDICHCGTENELKIYRQILEEVVKILPEHKEQAKRIAEEEQAQKLVRTRQKYVDICSSRLTDTVYNLRAGVESSQKTITDLQKKLTQEIRTLQENETRLMALEADNSSALERFGQEFDKLISLPKVREIEISNNKLEVYTDMLYCVDPRSSKNHKIGEFRIVISTDGSEGGIRWFNLTQIIYERSAPHIYRNGKACLGNIQEIIPELIAGHEYASAVMLAIQFVESVNTEDSFGKDISFWPES